jgi:hypothetical protein
VRAVNAAGAGPHTESSNSTPWVRTIGGEITETVYDSYTTSGCTTSCCGGCGTQSTQRRKFSQRQTRTDTWTRGGVAKPSQYVVVTNFTGDTNGDGVVDNWGLVSSFTACEVTGGCSAVSRVTYNGADGEIIAADGGYRTWSSFWGAWVITNSSGVPTGDDGTTTACGGGTTTTCYGMYTTATYCPTGVCPPAYAFSGYTTKASCCGFFGCVATTCS